MENINKKDREIYEALCRALTARGWRFDRDGEDLTVHIMLSGDYMPIEFVAGVDTERQLIRLVSLMPFLTPPQQTENMAKALGVINYKLPDGAFALDPVDGKILFRMTSSFKGMAVSDELIQYIFNFGCYTVNAANNTLLMLADGRITMEEFMDMAA